MKDLYKPNNNVELSLIKSIFDSEGIHYYVLNDNFGSLHIGPQIDLFNAQIIRVNETDYDKAKELLNDFLIKVQEDTGNETQKYSLWDKARMIIETVLFTWFIPGKKKNSNQKPKGGL